MVCFAIDINNGESISSFSFRERAPSNLVSDPNLINAPNGPNNYPRKFDVTVKRNGSTVFSDTNNSTTVNSWVSQSFTFPTAFTQDGSYEFCINWYDHF